MLAVSSIATRNGSARQSQVRQAVSNVVTATAALENLGPLDIVVQEGQWVIPQIGLTGYTTKGDVVFLTLDSESEALKANLDRPLERVIAHEFHHARRWDTVGCGKTLGEQLVTEGLAGRFVEEVYGNPPEPWECAVGADELRTHLDAAKKEWESADYDHMRWFFGKGDLPHWLGYTLGYQIVGRYLEVYPESQPSSLASEPATRFRAMLDCLVKQ